MATRLKIILVLFITLTGYLAQAESYSILQGTTSESVTHFTVVAKNTDDLSFKVQEEGGSVLPVSSSRSTYPGSEYVVYRIKLSGLNLKSEYQLQVFNRGALSDHRQFALLDTQKRSGRLAFGSCMVRQMHNPFLWNNLAKAQNRPDLLMIIGDAVYLDRPTVWRAQPPETGLQVWEEFVKARLKENLYFWDRLVPTVTIWDDHDSGGDGDDSSEALMPEIRRIYDIFFANEEIPGFIENGPGMAKKFRLFGKNFVMLDGRSYRNQTLTHPLFGPDQDRWLLQKVEPGPNFIVSGSQFYGRFIKKDSMEFNWPDYARDWTQVLREHGEWKKATFAFLSGDVHFSEVQDLEPELFGYRSVEITSSNIHSFGAPGHYLLKPANPRRRVVTGTHNIVLLDFSAADGGFGFLVRSMGWRGNDLFKTVVSIGSAATPPPRSTFSSPTCEDRVSPIDNRQL